MESDDEYEKERQENIQRNRDLMISLGINVSYQGTSD